MYALEIQNKQGRRTTVSSGEIYTIKGGEYKVIMVDPEAKQIALEGLYKAENLKDESYIEIKECFFFVTGERMMKSGVGQVCAYKPANEVPGDDEDEPDGGPDPDPEPPVAPQNPPTTAQTPPQANPSTENKKKSNTKANTPQNPVPAGAGA